MRIAPKCSLGTRENPTGSVVAMAEYKAYKEQKRQDEPSCTSSNDDTGEKLAHSVQSSAPHTDEKVASMLMADFLYRQYKKDSSADKPRERIQK